MTEELQELGLNVGHRRVGRLMCENGIKIIRTRKYKATTDSNHAFNIAPNLLDQDFSADAPNQKWAGDISYIWTSEGWLYLAVILDLYSRRVIGWAVSHRMKRDLAIRALDMALAHCRRTNDGQGLAFAPAAGGMHSSHGSWVAILFKRILETLIQTWLQNLDERQRQLLRQCDGRDVLQIPQSGVDLAQPMGNQAAG